MTNQEKAQIEMEVIWLFFIWHRNENEYYGFENIGTNYFSIDVNDVGLYKRRLDQHKIKYKYLVVSEWNDYKVILVHDPDGVLLEIRGY